MQYVQVDMSDKKKPRLNYTEFGCSKFIRISKKVAEILRGLIAETGANASCAELAYCT